jgi:nucleoid-associated protein YgaU
VLVLAVAGGAWFAFGRDDKKPSNNAIGPKVPTASPTKPVVGPVVPGTTHKPTVSPTSTRPVAATPAAPTASKPAPTKAAVSTKAPTPSPSAVAPSPAPTKAPTVSKPPVVKPPVTAPQVGGTVAKKAYTFKVARGDTLWGFTKKALAATGRSTSNASVAAYVTKLYENNRGVVGSDPDLILPGQVITWPAGL